MPSTAISDAILCLSSSFSVFLMAQRGNVSVLQRPAALGAMLGFLGFALASFFGTLRFGLGEQWLEVHSLFSQAATYMALPLIGMAFLCLTLPWQLSRPGWGRVLLALMVAFELIRRFEWLESYRLLLGGISLIIITLAVLRLMQSNRKIALLALAGVISSATAGLIIGTQGSIHGWLRVDFFHYLLALSNLCLGSALFLLLREPK